MRPIDADFLTDCFKSSLDTDETLFNEVMKKIIGVLEATPSIKTKEIKYYDDDEQVWKIGEVIVNSSEKPNNCEHITEDGVTCAKYPACDDCLDNPLNKVKGSERLVKGSDEPQTERSE